MKLENFKSFIMGNLAAFGGKNITDDTRNIKDGDTLLMHSKSVKFLSDVNKASVGCVVCPHSLLPMVVDLSASIIDIDDSEFSIGGVLAAFYSSCSLSGSARLPKKLVAITGTNGKASTVGFVKQMLHYAGKSVVAIENCKVLSGNGTDLGYNVELTTPPAPDMHKIFANSIGEYGIFEASSHGIKQGRLDGLDINVAAFTQLTQDHLDYHKTMEEYFATKKELFAEYLGVNGVAVLNADISEFESLLKTVEDRGIKVITYGVNGAGVKLNSMVTNNMKYKLNLTINGKDYDLQVPFVASFQNYNLMCAISVMLALNVDFDLFVGAIPSLTQPEGRMQQVIPKHNVYVDYAHTPDALCEVIKSARQACNGRVIILFGCGGNRDKTKRSKMGSIAATFADVVVLTDDNCREENADEIRKDIVSGIDKSLLFKVEEIGDRGQAIKYAINVAMPQDIVILAGKGHEDYQIIGAKKFHFSDVEIAKSILNAKAGK